VVRRRRRQRHAFTLRSPVPLRVCGRAGGRSRGRSGSRIVKAVRTLRACATYE
jgi:hypothetical protein